PEAQVDRFMFNVRVQYPSVTEEAKIIAGTTGTEVPQALAVLSAEDLLVLQDVVRSVPVADDVTMYAARLVAASRPAMAEAIEMVKKYVGYGASPRAGQALVLAGKARAVLDGRMHVDFADIKAVAHPVLRHRLVLNFHARADSIDSDLVVSRLLEELPEETV
ncbi:MAG: MoxR family ATPase, partial [Pirellulales bacterium]|nr:MoxR family ATPase [Pirellulales bacterium]